MSLIKCSECGREISDKAPVCPSCGNPVRPQSIVTTGENKVEVVQTSKKWKKAHLWGIAFAIIGFLTLSRSMGLGFFLIFIGLGFGVVSRVGAWWTNG